MKRIAYGLAWLVVAVMVGAEAMDAPPVCGRDVSMNDPRCHKCQTKGNR